MRLLIALGLASVTLGCSSRHEESTLKKHSDPANQHQDHGHKHGESDKGATLIVTTDSSPPRAGQETRLRLMIHSADGDMVRNFDEMHKEKVHLVIVSEALDHFAHLHPAVDAAGNLSVSYAFPSVGRYRLFADYTPAGGGPTTATGTLFLPGDPATMAAPVPNAPGAILADGVHATIAAESLKAGSSARVRFSLQVERGAPLALEPYMGELGHLMFIGIGNWKYVHVHPVGGVADRGEVEFEALFPGKGNYKGWGQFKHDGRVSVVPFVVKVD